MEEFDDDLIPVLTDTSYVKSHGLTNSAIKLSEKSPSMIKGCLFICFMHYY